MPAATSANGYSRSWRILLCLQPGSRVLEVSTDDGQRARALEQAGVEVVRWRRSDQVAQAESFDAAVVSLERTNRADSNWKTAHLEDLLSNLFSALRPGGTVLLSVPNPLFCLPGLSGLASWLAGTRVAVQPSAGSTRLHRRPNLRSICKSMQERGFKELICFAPLPDANKPKFLVPLGEPQVASYFFENLAPRARSSSRRVALRLARVASKLDCLETLVPSYEVLASKEAGS